MELQFQKREIACLRNLLSQPQTVEQTQEVRIPENLPGAARILGAWGQPVMRSKEWMGGSIQLSGGVLVWALYDPEDGSQPRCLNSWIPFQLRWDLSDGTAEGQVRCLPLLRSVDARLVSAGKIMIRVGISALAEAWAEESCQVFRPESVPEDLELLQQTYPVRLPRVIGEKPFTMEEELTLPSSAPKMEQLVYYRMEPMVSDRKVMGNRLVFRGTGNLHLLYLSGDGQLYGWDYDLPFSQFADLQESGSSDAQADILLSPTQLELELDPEGKLQLRAGMTAQYLVDDREVLELTEDAYSPRREMTIQQEQLRLPAQLDSRRENIYGELTIPIQADVVADVSFLPDFPRQRREGDEITLEQPGMLQLLYYDGEGKLQSAGHRWEGTHKLKADEDTRLLAVPLGTAAQLMPGGENMILRGEVPVQMMASGGSGINMVTGVTLGQLRQPDPGRPSLILRRAGDSSLWSIARESGSTVASIQAANGLQGEPAPEQMLLIPVV